MSTLIEQFRQSSPLFGGNAPFIEDLYERYLQDPNSVPDNWREYFRTFQEQLATGQDVAHGPIRESFIRLAKQAGFGSKPISVTMDQAAAEKQATVLRIINAYRTRGHQVAQLDPLALRDRPLISDLEPTFHGLTEADMDSVIGPPLAGIETSLGSHTLWLTQSHLAMLDDAGLVERWLDEHYPVITEQFPAGIKLTGYALRSRYEKVPQLADGALYPNAELAPGILVAACEVLTPRVSAQDTSMHPPSGWVHVRAWMQATEPATRDYEIVSQVVGPEGVWGVSLVRENDVLHRYPTSQWAVGETVRVEFDVNLNPITPPGDYAVTLESPGGGNGAVDCGRVDIE